MNTPPKLEKPRVPKRFYFLTMLIYLPIFYSLSVIGARWYGFVIAGVSFATYVIAPRGTAGMCRFASRSRLSRR